jgi:hypothetical protein
MLLVLEDKTAAKINYLDAGSANLLFTKDFKDHERCNSVGNLREKFYQSYNDDDTGYT